MSLQNLIFFAQHHDYSVKNIKTYCASNDSFLFSCVLISTLFWLKHFFHFDGDELTLFKGIDAVRVSRKGLKYLLSFANDEGSNNKYNGEEQGTSSEDARLEDAENVNNQFIEGSNKVNQFAELKKLLSVLFGNKKP
jgi:hypothetical protein